VDDAEGGFRHGEPLEAALALCSRGCLNEGLIRRVVGVYEATPRPEARASLYQDASPTNLTGRIVNLADHFVTLLGGLQPDEALRVLLAERQQSEPELIKVFVNAVGLYPVGTIVSLESGARAVVVEAPRRRQQLLRPVVQIIGSDGAALVDLSVDDQGHGQIVGSVDPAEARVNVSHFFLL
jgi:hypothetical protein